MKGLSGHIGLQLVFFFFVIVFKPLVHMCIAGSSRRVWCHN